MHEHHLRVVLSQGQGGFSKIAFYRQADVSYNKGQSIMRIGEKWMER